MIELLPFHPPGEEAGAPAGAPVGMPSGAGYLYRVTAIGFGAQEDTQVVLQTYYRKQAPGETP
jgi:type IV pilus assembly protein PilX